MLLTSLILTGCGSKTSFSVNFDEFRFKLYDNGKQYIIMPADTSTIDMKVLTEMKEQVQTGTEDTTGFINSLLIVRTPIQSWIIIKDLVDANIQQLKLKLMKYKNTDSGAKKVKCDDLQYSWYMNAFSYQLDNQTLYDGQYFFTDNEALYLISLSSDTYKDIQSFIKSLWTITCIN